MISVLNLTSTYMRVLKLYSHVLRVNFLKQSSRLKGKSTKRVLKEVA